MSNVLVIGGTSGLGYELAKRFDGEGDDVFMAGRRDRGYDFGTYKHLVIKANTSEQRIGRLIMEVPDIATLVFAAGQLEQGHITDFTPEQIRDMDEFTMAYKMAAREILLRQDELQEQIVITSTSQFKPREFEPDYNGTKAATGIVALAIGKDPRVKKTSVIAPAGMKTPFWDRNPGQRPPDYDTFMKPGDVADKVMKLREQDLEGKVAKILRNPMRVEVVDFDE